MNFKFRKPYGRQREKGINPNAIVVFRSKPESYGDDYDEIRKWLYVDLWLFTFTYSWVKKIPPTRSKKIYGNL